MIEIVPGLLIPENEVTFSMSRSGGPGGQNVNKVSSKVMLSFDVVRSTALTEEQKGDILRKLVTRINKDGELQVVSQRTRSQELNRTDAISKFAALVRNAIIAERPRVKTRVPGAAKKQRRDEKKKRALVKQTRSRRGWDS